MRIVTAVALLALLATIPVGAEDDPAQAIHWSWQLEPADAGPDSEAELVLVAALAPHWVVYSSDFSAGIGPRPARLVKSSDSTLGLLGPLRSIDAKRKRDAAFNAEYGYFSGRVELRQRVRLPTDGGPLAATLRGQACNEADGSCHLIRQEIRIEPR